MGRTAQRGEQGWMVVFRPDQLAQMDGIDEEAFTVIYRRLERAKEECSKYLENRAKLEPEMGVTDYRIDWAKDGESSKEQEIWFGRPRALLDGNFYLYEVRIE